MPVQACPVLRCGEGPGRAAFVILRSEATKNPKPLCEHYVYILTNETHSLHVESERRMWVELSAGWSEALDSSRSLP